MQAQKRALNRHALNRHMQLHMLMSAYTHTYTAALTPPCVCTHHTQNCTFTCRKHNNTQTHTHTNTRASHLECINDAREEGLWSLLASWQCSSSSRGSLLRQQTHHKVTEHKGVGVPVCECGCACVSVFVCAYVVCVHMCMCVCVV